MWPGRPSDSFSCIQTSPFAADKSFMGCSSTSLSGAYSASLEGLSKASDRVQQAAVAIAGAADPSSGFDTVDLSTAIIGLLDGQNSFAANVKAIQATDEIQKSTLSLLA